MTALVALSRSLIKPDKHVVLGRTVRPPTPAIDHSRYAFMLVGWVVGRHSPVERVELLHHGKVVQSAAVEADLPSVAARFPETAWAATSSWHMIVDSRALETTFTCELRAVLADGTAVPLAVVEGQRQPLPRAGAHNLQPLIVTALGRSGTTWLMRLLAEHPEIIAYREYPYEMRPALYWVRMFSVLTGIADYSRPISHPGSFQNDAFAVGANPFHGSMFSGHPRLQEWSQHAYVENLATFCFASIESWYRSLETSQAQPNAIYFAEKHHHFLDEYHPNLMWELYPGMREIFLVRDFRDVASSALTFNAHRGHPGFGREHVASDEAFLHDLRRQAANLRDQWRRRSDRSHLVCYEDLIRTPHDTLRAVLAYAELDSSPATIDGMIERASAETSELRRHQTSASPGTSIGRWRRDLDPALRAVAADLFDDILADFGYGEPITQARRRGRRVKAAPCCRG